MPSISTSGNSLYAGSVGVNVAGLVAGTGQYTNVYNDRWMGNNGKWNSMDWGGNGATGSRSSAVFAADAMRVVGQGMFFAGSAISLYQGATNLKERNYGGVGKSAADFAMGGIATFGGPPGLAAGAGYLAIDYTVGIESASGPVTDFLCWSSGNC